MADTDQLKFVCDLVRSAGPIALRHYGNAQRLTKTHAAAMDEAVTAADRDVQRHLVAGLRKRFPGDGIIGEEDDAGLGITADIADPLGRNWVIDPIDGTNNFVAGLDHWAICVGLLDRGHPLLGVVYEVRRDALHAAERGRGATLNARPIRAPEGAMAASSVLMLTSNVIDRSGKCPKWASDLLAQTTWKLRVLGSAAVEAVSVASGVAHAAITVNGKLWDCVAPAAIVQEAGGVISGLRGEPVFPFDLRNYTGAKVPYLAAGAAAHRRMIEWIAAGA